MKPPITLLTDSRDGLPILLINASALKESGCFRRLFWTSVSGYKEATYHPKVAIEFGVAFHKFLAHHYSGEDTFSSIPKAVEYYNKVGLEFDEKEYRTPERLFDAALQYADYYKFDNLTALRAEGEPLVEQKFAIEIEFFAQIYGVHVILVGTIDLVGNLGDEVVIVDHKTTSVWDEDDYLEAYQASPQLKFYSYVLKLHAKKFKVPAFERAGAMINGIFLKKTKPPTFKRSEVFYYSDTSLKEFEQLMTEKIARLCLEIPRNTSDLPLADGMLHNLCHSHFGKCPFFRACTQANCEDTESVLRNNFITDVYDPRKTGGEL